MRRPNQLATANVPAEVSISQETCTERAVDEQEKEDQKNLVGERRKEPAQPGRRGVFRAGTIRIVGLDNKFW